MMKKLIYVWVALFSISSLYAQDNFAKNLLDEVSKKYDSYKTIQSDFTFKATNAQGESYSDKGQLFLNKAKQNYHIVLPAQELISDGKSVWSVLKEDKEIQVTDAENNDQSIGPNNIFTFYRKGYKYISMDDETVDKAGKMNVVELSPIDSKSNYFKIKVRINKNKHIHDVAIFDKSGAKYTYTIQTLYVNHQIADSHFVYEKNKFPGMELVDLR
ncbi:LolA family protein [Sphingobacterium sp. HJSM2_6]|uniref:LolA family protein n=1 Tax=Sphingobacterium sp. HJSM2_6 TaxID=3366264 RepID=UPI003BBA661D